VREAWGERPLFVRVSATDWAAGGTTPEDAVAIARALVDAGADVIDVSGGGTVAHQKPERFHLAHALFADRIRHEAGVPVMAVGGVHGWDDANTLLAAGRADLVGLAREHLYDPYFTRHAAVGQGAPLPWPVPYARTRTTPEP
jgi:anthraniloyl-CoA monooxygenase